MPKVIQVVSGRVTLKIQFVELQNPFFQLLNHFPFRWTLQSRMYFLVRSPRMGRQRKNSVFPLRSCNSPDTVMGAFLHFILSNSQNNNEYKNVYFIPFRHKEAKGPPTLNSVATKFLSLKKISFLPEFSSN